MIPVNTVTETTPPLITDLTGSRIPVTPGSHVHSHTPLSSDEEESPPLPLVDEPSEPLQYPRDLVDDSVVDLQVTPRPETPVTEGRE